MNRCLYCYKELKAGEKDFHTACARKFFGSSVVPELPYSHSDLKELAKQVVKSQTTIAGVQPKLSMYLDKSLRGSPKLTIVGLWGNYILKPQSPVYPSLPENEDMSMHLAEIVGIKTVQHSLIRFSDGELCYITKRIDRTASGEKIPMEDMAQLTMRLSEDKYKSSYEQIAKTVRIYSDIIGLDIVALAEQILFSWIIGNSDMHLKNFSLIRLDEKWQLSAAYDMLNVKLAMPSDKEELALVLNGKGNSYHYKSEEFKKAFATFGMSVDAIDNLFNRFTKAKTKLCNFISCGFLSAQMAEFYSNVIAERLGRLEA